MHSVFNFNINIKKNKLQRHLIFDTSYFLTTKMFSDTGTRLNFVKIVYGKKLPVLELKGENLITPFYFHVSVTSSRSEESSYN